MTSLSTVLFASKFYFLPLYSLLNSENSEISNLFSYVSYSPHLAPSCIHCSSGKFNYAKAVSKFNYTSASRRRNVKGFLLIHWRIESEIRMSRCVVGMLLWGFNLRNFQWNVSYSSKEYLRSLRLCWDYVALR